MAKEKAAREMKSTPTEGHVVIQYDHYEERDHEGNGVGEPVPMTACIRRYAETVLENRRFSLGVYVQVETCSQFWVRVLVFEHTELVCTRLVIIQQGNIPQAQLRAVEIAQAYFDKRESQLLETHQEALLPEAVA